MNDVVVRLHRSLIDALQQRAVRLDQPVTVAEIYQELIPYRLVRSFGFALNADYEFALLQMLAGEGNLVRIEPPEVREELRLELLSPNPNVGMFRQYAACDVFVTGEDVPQASAPARAPETRKQDGAQRPVVPHDWLLIEEQRSGTAQTPAQRTEADKPQQGATPAAAPATPAAQTPAGAQRPAPVAQPKPEPVKAKAAEVQPEPPKPSGPAKPQPAATGAAGLGCAACGHGFPRGRSVRFCPNCGKEQRGRCTNCGEDIEPAWRFCITCGTSV